MEDFDFVFILFAAFFEFCAIAFATTLGRKKCLHECRKIYLRRMPDSIDMVFIEVKSTYNVVLVSGVQ